MQKSDVDQRFRVIFIIWVGLFMGVTFFAGVVWALASGRLGAWSPSMEPGVVRNLLAAPILLMAAGIAYRRGQDDRSHGADAFVAAYQTRIVIVSAMQEGGGLLGLVLCLLAGMPTWALGVWAVTAVAMLMSRPRREDLHHLEA